ncbi:MAG: hypothetical protein IKP87_14100 [Victivallales bacterium]|nr:hypothetical protein [Victivallales bacterium]
MHALPASFAPLPCQGLQALSAPEIVHDGVAKPCHEKMKERQSDDRDQGQLKDGHCFNALAYERLRFFVEANGEDATKQNDQGGQNCQIHHGLLWLVEF